MRILVANDDGVGAPGVALLARAAEALTPDVWTVLPDHKWTAASHQLSFDRDLYLTRLGERSYACSGAPADCVVAALTILFAHAPKPNLVLAGINDKRNVGEDLAYSGTAAIAREAAFWGIPAISLSRVDGTIAAPGDLDAVRELLRILWNGRAAWIADGVWLTLNLPARLPARLVQARTGRDKIASAVDVLESSPERIRFRLRRGRSGASTPGDENARLTAGEASVVRYCWHAEAPLSEDAVAAWRRPAAAGPTGGAVGG